MKKSKIAVVLLLAAAMVLSLAGCGSKGPDVTGKYICVGESYGGEYSEPYSESFIELKKGGKGTYSSGFDFSMKWNLEGEDFNATVTFLGMEESMVGTLKDGVLEVKYGESMMMIFVKEGMEKPKDLGASGADPTSKPVAGSAPGDTLDGAGDTFDDADAGEKTGVNEDAAVAATLVGAFEGAGSPFGEAAGSTAAANGETAVGILLPAKIENPSTWYGYVHCTYCWGIEQDEILRDAWAFVDTADKPYLEVYQSTNMESPFVSMYMTLEDNDTTILPDIGYEDAWLIDVYLESEDTEDFTFLLLDDGTLAAGAEYTAPDGSYGFFVTMRFRPDGSLWDEDADRLPPGYEDYKAELLMQ